MQEMKNKGLRVEVDGRAEKIGYKIREAQVQKIPYSLVVGEKEVEDRLVSVRKRDEGDLGQMDVDSFIEKLISENDNKDK